METEVQVIDVDYVIEQDRPVVRVFGKDAKGKNVLARDTGFRPYFYAIPSGDIKRLEEAVDDTRFKKDGESLPVKDTERVVRADGNSEVEVLKVYTDVPPTVPKLRELVSKLDQVSEIREFDIPFYKRYLIDKQLPPVKWVKVSGEAQSSENFDLVLELESIERSSHDQDLDFERLAFDLEVYEDEIIMASFYSQGFEKLLTTKEIDRDFVEVVDSEKELLERMMDIIEGRDVDILTGYNTDEFDFQVLRERAQHHGLELALGRNGERMKFKRRGRFSSARLKGRMHLDLYPFLAHILSPGLESETLDLDSVAEEMLGKNKDELSWEQMKQYWEEDEKLEVFADYALKDSELAFELSEELVPQVMELSRITGLIPFDACRLTYGQLTENYLLREAFERGRIAPNRPHRDERRQRRRKGAYSGGYVHTPEAGLYDDIVLLDFRSLYPTVMVAHNISPDTLDLEECDNRFEIEEFDYDFCQDEQGFFPELIQQLVEDRAGLKQEMESLDSGSKEYRSLDSRQKAEKILANSFYGYLGYDGARWYSRECAEATTYLGRRYIKQAVEKAEEEGFEVVYGDTDSLFLRGERVEERIDGFLEEVNHDLPEFMELEFEGYFRRGFFTSTSSGEGAKKKYALVGEDGRLKITGFEQVRRDWSPIAKETQKEVLREILEDDAEEAAEIVKQTVEALKAGEIPVEKLRIYTRLTKKPENYESTAPHVEAAKKAIERGEDISPGSTIDYVITRGSGSISSRAELVKYADSYDPDYYIDNQIVPASLRALKVFGYTGDQLKGKGKQSGLGRFG